MPVRFVAVVMLFIAGCGGQVAEEVLALERARPAPPPEVLGAATEPVVPDRELYRFDAEKADSVTLVALLKGEVEALTEPGTGDPVSTLPATTIMGTTTVATVVGQPVDGWLEVMLPIRPNGSTGWIPVEMVELYVVEGEIVVDLKERRLTYYRGGKEVLSSEVGIGSRTHPTPSGTFFVTDRVTVTDSNSAWGPHALGLSARSDVITEYNGGDGIVGIHGTNRPGSIGKASSLGCIRLPNHVITELHALVPIGTPVVIRS